jgi:hypothetical protein
MKYGYFIKFENESPEMTTDPLEATRLTLKRALKIISKIEQLGLEGRLININIVGYYDRGLLKT